MTKYSLTDYFDISAADYSNPVFRSNPALPIGLLLSVAFTLVLRYAASETNESVHSFCVATTSVCVFRYEGRRQSGPAISVQPPYVQPLQHVRIHFRSRSCPSVRPFVSIHYIFNRLTFELEHLCMCVCLCVCVMTIARLRLKVKVIGVTRCI